MRSIHRAALSAAAVVLVGATAACGGSDEGDEGAFGGERGGEATSGDAFTAVQAAAESTTEVTSAGFTATTSGPAAAGGAVEMSGVMSWGDDLVMDATVSGEALQMDPESPSEMRMIMLGDVMYMNMGESFAAEFYGREWMMMDMGALAEESGDPTLAQAMDLGLSESNQDPASQMALLLQSPDIESVGEEEIDGVTTEHYQGTVSVEDALQNNGAGDLFTEEELQQLTDSMEQQGIESYDIDVWVDENDFPIQIRQAFESTMGPVTTEVRYTDLGADVDVAAPEEGSYVDFMELMESMGATPGDI
ncbi:hypothetical protein E1265_18890 [Streptomyces sp. 8K308]|uniref:hypothetical protein n=1 Tax=Streptomyces sp. 8K308 TaxID=2530388 RepID=UPI001048CF19|nr:hypothetical protein [Streptomyces sp. 8K308]TDC21115.1 hypothetical protein E1265_18890 [Streptomyces sp. 8K308]